VLVLVFIFGALVLPVGAEFMLPFVDGARVAAGVGVLAGLVLLLPLPLPLGAVPPSQAIPKAPKTKTAESAITFFI